MAIAFDAVVNGGNNPASWSHTATGDDRVLIVAFDGTNRPASVTYAGVAMTSMGSVANATTGRTIDVYYLANPAAGANSVVPSGGSSFVGISLSYTGAKQSGIPDALAAANGVSGATHSQSVTTVADNCWVVAFTDTDGVNSTAGANTTRRSASASIAFEAFDSNSAKTPAGAHTLNFTSGASVNWASFGFSLAPSLSSGGFLLVF